MFRCFFAAYMLLLSLTGPAPCCCTMARLAAIAAGGRVECQNLPCCGRHTGNSRRSAQFPSSQHAPNHSGDHCKCTKSFCNNSTPKLEVVLDSSVSWIDQWCLNNSGTVLLCLSEPKFATTCFTRPPNSVRSGQALRASLCSWRC